MGCGSSSLPADAPKGGEFEPDSKTKGAPDEPSVDSVEAFQNGTPSPSPSPKKERETLEQQEMPSPSTYKSDSAALYDGRDYSSAVQNYGQSDSPLGSQDIMNSPADPWQ